MEITISFPPGFDVEGIVLSVHGNSMRVAMRDWDDTGAFGHAPAPRGHAVDLLANATSWPANRQPTGW